mmetsp:Transcript_37361/g.73484  ORF Transcript_37361/g.73484 Transcript_37361/m.73484 type:complete len:123 (+) Transcript_37361:57-425(+)
MEDLSESEKYEFQEELVQKKVVEVIETHLKNADYQEEKINQWVSNICEACMEELHAPKKPFKYVVTCMIMQRTGDAVHTATAAYWDTVADASISVAWPKRNDTKGTMCCIVTVFAVSFSPTR